MNVSPYHFILLLEDLHFAGNEIFEITIELRSLYVALKKDIRDFCISDVFLNGGVSRKVS